MARLGSLAAAGRSDDRNTGLRPRVYFTLVLQRIESHDASMSSPGRSPIGSTRETRFSLLAKDVRKHPD